ncbi:hypothetical protein LTR05_007733 [Lithohypha guttulata]|uniref:Major facilitator superfamily (MFS) profile domain-containing protein n=1 Tax=Lithohypha guttulata TaxID=1690604 RepID=A0AAN7SU47_9EURO|nr:hypothetical protein LTR05_007733 [Lithohypha guttulata]
MAESVSGQSLSISAEHEPLLGDLDSEDLAVDQRAATVHNSATAKTKRELVLLRWRHFESKIKVAAVMFCFFVTGMHVTSIGVLLPVVESYYSLSDTQAAFIFPLGVIGYVCGTISLTNTLSRYGWRGMASAAPFLHVVAMSTLSTGPPFFVVLFAHFAAGLGTGHSDAGVCAWASRLPYANVVQGLIHGSFALGCITGPVLCVAVLQVNLQWYVFYRIMIVFTILEFIVLAAAFRHEDLKRYMAAHDPQPEEMETGSSPRTKLVWLCGLFYFVYLGAESSFTNWTPTYMQRIRHADSTTASLSSSIFWLGMALGRFFLGPVTEYFGLPVSVSAYILLGTLSELIFKLTSSIKVALFTLSGCGFFLGPMFPSGVLLLSQKLNKQQYVGGVALAAAFGQIGGAGAPLIIGFMADRLGLQHLTDVVLVLFILLLMTWMLFCRFS